MRNFSYNELARKASENCSSAFVMPTVRWTHSQCNLSEAPRVKRASGDWRLLSCHGTLFLKFLAERLMPRSSFFVMHFCLFGTTRVGLPSTSNTTGSLSNEARPSIVCWKRSLRPSWNDGQNSKDCRLYQLWPTVHNKIVKFAHIPKPRHSLMQDWLEIVRWHFCNLKEQ